MKSKCKKIHLYSNCNKKNCIVHMVVTTINVLKQIQGKSMLQQNRRVDKRGGQGDVTFIFQSANCCRCRSHRFGFAAAPRESPTLKDDQVV